MTRQKKLARLFESFCGPKTDMKKMLQKVDLVKVEVGGGRPRETDIYKHGGHLKTLKLSAQRSTLVVGPNFLNGVPQM